MQGQRVHAARAEDAVDVVRDPYHGRLALGIGQVGVIGASLLVVVVIQANRGETVEGGGQEDGAGVEGRGTVGFKGGE